MKRTIASAAVIALMAGAAGTAFAKGHKAETGPHAFGQDRADESYVVGGETAKLLAKNETKGLDATELETLKETIDNVDRGPADPPKGMPE